MSALHTDPKTRSSRHPFLAALLASGAVLFFLFAVSVCALVVSGGGQESGAATSLGEYVGLAFMSATAAVFPAVLTANAASLIGLRGRAAFLWALLGFGVVGFTLLATSGVAQ